MHLPRDAGDGAVRAGPRRLPVVLVGEERALAVAVRRHVVGGSVQNLFGCHYGSPITPLRHRMAASWVVFLRSLTQPSQGSQDTNMTASGRVEYPFICASAFALLSACVEMQA